MNRPKVILLSILDGWGLSSSQEANAVHLAHTPTLDHLKEEYPSTELKCSGQSVGLPKGIMGNSEVGHLNIGAGRVVYQDLLKIDRAIENGSFFDNRALRHIMNAVKQNRSSLHLMGLVSDGGVHSQLSHLTALLEMARLSGLDKVYVHAILDGRDTPPNSGVDYLRRVQTSMQQIGVGSVASICGRYYAMDRDKRWDRIEMAYRLYVLGEGRFETDPISAIEKAYARDETDEFVKPVAMTNSDNQPEALMRSDDGIIFFNFRADRAREITRALTDEEFKEFDRSPTPLPTGFVCMTQYDEKFSLPIAFPPESLNDILGDIISRDGLAQLRIAETEKYAHVTYFFNGGEEKPFPLEDRCLIPSPRDVATYDMKPEMSALEVTDEVITRLESQQYDLIVLNFANMDMVGHTGVLTAAIKACETVDRCIARIVATVKAQNGIAIITADHGNSEKMREVDGQIHTAHTQNPVPFILVDETRRGSRLRKGILADIAPTILELFNIPKPDAMTACSLLS